MKTCRKGLHQYEGQRCKECHQLATKAWRDANPRRHKANQDRWFKADVNVEKARLRSEKWRKQNPQKYSSYLKSNPDKINAKAAKRRAAKLKRTPSWLTKEHLETIQDFYTHAAKLTKTTGIPHDVDHIVPLQGKDVNGLHVPWNLQVITESLNCKKGNKFDVDSERNE